MGDKVPLGAFAVGLRLVLESGVVQARWNFARVWISQNICPAIRVRQGIVVEGWEGLHWLNQKLISDITILRHAVSDDGSGNALRIGCPYHTRLVKNDGDSIC